MQWVEKYIGIPFKSNGRTKEGCDCYGLVRMALLEESGVALDSYASEYDEAYNLSEAEKVIRCHKGMVSLLSEGEDIKPLDIVLFKIKGFVCHMGLVVDPKAGKFLNTLRNKNSHLASYKSSAYSRRIEGFYRYVTKL